MTNQCVISVENKRMDITKALLSNVSTEELFGVLSCGKELIKGVTLLEYMKELNNRIEKDGGYEVIVE